MVNDLFIRLELIKAAYFEYLRGSTDAEGLQNNIYNPLSGQHTPTNNCCGR